MSRTDTLGREESVAAFVARKGKERSRGALGGTGMEFAPSDHMTLVNRNPPNPNSIATFPGERYARPTIAATLVVMGSLLWSGCANKQPPNTVPPSVAQHTAPVEPSSEWDGAENPEAPPVEGNASDAPGSPGAPPEPSAAPPGGPNTETGAAADGSDAYGGSARSTNGAPSGQTAIDSTTVDKFARAYVEVSRLQRSFAQSMGEVQTPEEANRVQQQATSALTSAVEAEGLSPAEFNELAEATQRDGELRRRVENAIQEEVR